MKVGRPLEFDPEQALEAATRLFWQQGYEGTSMADLMSAMRLSKSSLYQSFGSKQDLFLQCIEHYGASSYTAMKGLLTQAASPKQFIHDLFQLSYDQKLNVDMQKGCLFVNSSCELGHESAEVAPLLAAKIKNNSKILQLAIEQAQAAGEISQDKDAKQLADYLMVSLSGLKVMARLNKKASEMKNVTRQILQALE